MKTTKECFEDSEGSFIGLKDGVNEKVEVSYGRSKQVIQLHRLKE
jgi:hypothetical protein